MAHFAHVTNGIVDSVIVINEDTIANKGGWYCPECFEFKPLSEWIQTSYNTHEGVHRLGGTPLRKNYAGIGYTYDAVRDAFFPPRPFNSWLIDEEKGNYKAPKNKPIDGYYYDWSEEDEDWVKIK